MKARLLILIAGCLVLCSACGSKQVPYTYADPQYLQGRLPSVRTVCILPFAYLTNQRSLPEQFGEPVAGMVSAEVRRRLVERALRVTEQDLVNRLLLSKGIVLETTPEFTLLPATVKYDLAYVRFSEAMREMLRDYVMASESAPEDGGAALTVRSRPLSPELVAEIGKELGADIVVRGRVVGLGRPVVEPVGYEHAIIPRFVGNRDGVVELAAYEEGLEPPPGTDMMLVEETILPRSKVIDYMALQVRLFAQDTGDGRVVWSNTAVVTCSTVFDSIVDRRSELERLEKSIAEEVEALIGDLFR